MRLEEFWSPTPVISYRFYYKTPKRRGLLCYATHFTEPSKVGVVKFDDDKPNSNPYKRSGFYSWKIDRDLSKREVIAHRTQILSPEFRTRPVIAVVENYGTIVEHSFGYRAQGQVPVKVFSNLWWFGYLFPNLAYKFTMRRVRKYVANRYSEAYYNC